MRGRCGRETIIVTKEQKRAKKVAAKFSVWEVCAVGLYKYFRPWHTEESNGYILGRCNSLLAAYHSQYTTYNSLQINNKIDFAQIYSEHLS